MSTAFHSSRSSDVQDDEQHSVSVLLDAYIRLLVITLKALAGAVWGIILVAMVYLMKALPAADQGRIQLEQHGRDGGASRPRFGGVEIDHQLK